MLRTLLAAAASALIAATPTSFDVEQIAHAKGPISAQYATTVDGKSITVHQPGRPTVIVLFASWCVGCMDELPVVLKDYERYKGRVDFIGVDYLDSDSGLKAVQKRFAFPFPIVREKADANVPAPLKAGQTHPESAFVLHGLTAKQLTSATVDAIGKSLSAENVAMLRDIVARCASLDAVACDTYARSKGATFDAPGSVTARATPIPQPTSTNDTNVLSLPYTIVLGPDGSVVTSVDGYNSAHDPVNEALQKLHVPASASP